MQKDRLNRFTHFSRQIILIEITRSKRKFHKIKYFSLCVASLYRDSHLLFQRLSNFCFTSFQCIFFFCKLTSLLTRILTMRDTSYLVKKKKRKKERLPSWEAVFSTLCCFQYILKKKTLHVAVRLLYHVVISLCCSFAESNVPMKIYTTS